MAPALSGEADVAQVVKGYLEAGERDPALIACNTAFRLFRSRRCQVFPPPSSAPVSVRAAWDRLLSYVDSAFTEQGLVPGDESALPPGVQWSVVSTAEGSVDLEAYPWHEPSIHENGMATPSTFWVAKPGDSDSSLVRDYLFASLAMAGMDPSPAFDDSKLGRRLRREARELVLSAGWNDARVTSRSATLAGGRDPGTHGPGDAGIVHVLGRQGRGLVWAPRHYDDLARLAGGLRPKRGVDLHGEAIGSGRSPMVLYLPAINLQALRSMTPVLTTDGLSWPDNGKSTLYPPSAVDELGIDTSGVAPE
jgi:hypothetical protein